MNRFDLEMEPEFRYQYALARFGTSLGTGLDASGRIVETNHFQFTFTPHLEFPTSP